MQETSERAGYISKKISHKKKESKNCESLWEIDFLKAYKL